MFVKDWKCAKFFIFLKFLKSGNDECICEPTSPKPMIFYSRFLLEINFSETL